MNTLIALVVGAATVYLAYTFYAARVDRDIIKPDPKKATPAKMYMDGVDFTPAGRNVLYGYQFKSIAAAGPIVGAITAATLWGWLPSLLWLILGVSFIGWVQDYSAMMMAVRRDGDSLSAVAHKLISPRVRTILLIFIFFYLLTVMGAFGNLLAGAINANTYVPFGLIFLILMGLLGGQMLYKWKTDIIIVTLVTVIVTLVAIALGPWGTTTVEGKTVLGPIAQATANLNASINAVYPGFKFFDPTAAGYKGADVTISGSYLFWLLAVMAFCYAGAVLPIWRWAQPINYIGFWVMGLTILFGFLGAAIALFVKPELATFKIPPMIAWEPIAGANPSIQPLWPMLFVTIACGAISGWHSLVSTVGTGRQLENETDALPVGAGSMLSEMLLALLALMAISVAGKGAGAAAFASGVGNFLSIFGIPISFGTAFGMAAFIIIVITVMQLAVRFMRVAISEALGDSMPIMRNVHVGTIIAIILTVLVVLSGTFTYLWQLFGGANQLMAALALMLVTLWLVSEGRNPLYAAVPMLFMYVTTIAANLITAYNLWAAVLVPNLGKPGREIPVFGAICLVLIALFLVAAALYIGWEAWGAYQRLKAKAPTEAPAKA